MPDPGTALNIASLGYDVCKDLLNYYRKWRHSASDVKEICNFIEALENSFANVRDIINSKHSTLSVDRLDLATRSLQSCNSGIDRLKYRVKKLRLHEESNGWRKRTAHELRRAFYPLKFETLQKTTDIVAELRTNLAYVVEIISL